MHVEPGSQSAAHEAIPSPTIGQSRPSKRALLPTPRHTGPHAHAWTPPAGALQTASPRGSASAPRNAHTEEPRACAQWLGVPRTTAPPRSCVGVFTPLCPRPPSPSLARRSFSPFSAPYPPREGLVWLRCLYLLLPPPPHFPPFARYCYGRPGRRLRPSAGPASESRPAASWLSPCAQLPHLSPRPVLCHGPPGAASRGGPPWGRQGGRHPPSSRRRRGGGARRGGGGRRADGGVWKWRRRRRGGGGGAVGGGRFWGRL